MSTQQDVGTGSAEAAAPGRGAGGAERSTGRDPGDTGEVGDVRLPPTLPLAPDGTVHLGADAHALLLDVDGVLHDHRTAADAAAWAWASTLPGWSLGPRETADLWEAVDRKHFARYQHGELTYAEQLRARVREIVPDGEGLTDAEAQDRVDDYLAEYREHWAPYDDVADLLARLRSAVARRAQEGNPLRVAYLTNGSAVTQRDKLEAIGALVPGWPLLASAEIGVTKPNPRAFALACERLGVDPEQTVMVGDDAWADIDGATGAGLRCVHLRRSPEAPARPVATVSTLRDLVLD